MRPQPTCIACIRVDAITTTKQCDTCGNAVRSRSSQTTSPRCTPCRLQSPRPTLVRKKPCSGCSKLLIVTALSATEPMCRDCRAQRRKQSPRCAWCGDRKPNPRAKYCTQSCAARSDGDRRKIRSAQDPHTQRWQRERDAPGLTSHARAKVLHRWRSTTPGLRLLRPHQPPPLTTSYPSCAAARTMRATSHRAASAATQAKAGSLSSSGGPSAGYHP